MSDELNQQELRDRLGGLRWLAMLTGIPGFGFLFLASEQVNSTHGVFLGASGFGTSVTFAITGYLAEKSRRFLSTGDFVRIIAWACVGAGVSSAILQSYRETPLTTLLSGVAILGGLLTVIVSLFLWPRLPVWEPGSCTQCGYPLRGLPLPRCPECGTPFDPDKTPFFHRAGIDPKTGLPIKKQDSSE